MAKPLSEKEVVKFIKNNLKEWTFEDNTIKRDAKFKTFVEAFSFMTQIAMEAEKMDHHPNWSNSYNKVKISLTTDSEKSVTQLDFDLATKIDNIYKKYSEGVK
ncbi:MAG TPA: 4a-hydroxytetrahydrobiopterin dehydratase, partial [Marinilabiliaceae bacterium]|nr:4a-hydroxytetrahydrobiopterin dehydratase [Marinilabiliaceae bacterium]